jgi:hypothetical protein
LFFHYRSNSTPNILELYLVRGEEVEERPEVEGGEDGRKSGGEDVVMVWTETERGVEIHRKFRIG